MKKILFYFSISILLISCENITNYHLSNGLKLFGNYKPGSYWIYHNDSLNLNDTIKVIDSGTTIESGSKDGLFDKLFIIYSSSYYDSLLFDYLAAECDCYFRYHCRYKKYYESIGAPDFYLHHESDNSYTTLEGSVDYLYNYTSNAKTYDKVIHYLSNETKNEYFFVPNNGIIKFKNYKISKDTEWYLIDSKIIY